MNKSSTTPRNQENLKLAINKLNAVIQSLNYKFEQYEKLIQPQRRISYYSEQIAYLQNRKKFLKKRIKMLKTNIEYFQSKRNGLKIIQKKQRKSLDHCIHMNEVYISNCASELRTVESDIICYTHQIEYLKENVKLNAPNIEKLKQEYNRQIIKEYNPLVNFLNPSSSIKTNIRTPKKLSLLPQYPSWSIKTNGETENDR